MNPIDRKILEDFRKDRENFVQMEEVVSGILHRIVDEIGVLPAVIEHRVKSEKSLEGKLFRNGGYYHQMSELTDLLGARVICFFQDEVEKVGKLVEREFEIDWDNSSNKKDLLREDSFGYLSLHYTCRLTEEKGYPANLCGRKFEIQIRTVLQHAWAGANHDFGYKNEFGVPKGVMRSFFRLAALLEMADDEFFRLRERVKTYTEEIREKIVENRAEEVTLDQISLREYMTHNKRMQSFLSELGEATGAEIVPADPESYLPLLAWFGIEQLGGVQNLLEQNGPMALNMAKLLLGSTDLDILSTNVALRFLTLSELLRGGYSEEQAAEYIDLSAHNAERARQQAARLMKLKL